MPIRTIPGKAGQDFRDPVCWNVFAQGGGNMSILQLSLCVQLCEKDYLT